MGKVHKFERAQPGCKSTLTANSLSPLPKTNKQSETSMASNDSYLCKHLTWGRFCPVARVSSEFPAWALTVRTCLPRDGQRRWGVPRHIAPLYFAQMGQRCGTPPLHSALSTLHTNTRPSCLRETHVHSRAASLFLERLCHLLLLVFHSGTGKKKEMPGITLTRSLLILVLILIHSCP